MNTFSDKVILTISGLTNVIFGSGGGILSVIALKKQGLNQKSAQATALCTTLIISVFSVFYYVINDYFNIIDSFKYIPFGIPGALTGSYILKKTPDGMLKRLFSLFIIWSGLRLIFK